MFSLIKTTLSNHLEKFAIFNRQNPTLRTFFPNALDEVDEANIERLIDMLKTSFRLDQLCDCDSLKQNHDCWENTVRNHDAGVRYFQTRQRTLRGRQRRLLFKRIYRQRLVWFFFLEAFEPS